MTVAVVDTGYDIINVSDTNGTITNLEVSGDNTLIVLVVTFNNDGFETVQNFPTWNGDENFTKKVVVANDDDGQVEIWYLVNPTATTANVAVSFSSALTNSDGGLISAIVFTGVDQDTPLGTAVTTTNDAQTSISVAPDSASGDMVVGGLYCEYGSTSAPTSGQTEVYDHEWSGSSASASYDTADAGTTTFSYSMTFNSGSHASLAAVAVKKKSARTYQFGELDTATYEFGPVVSGTVYTLGFLQSGANFGATTPVTATVTFDSGDNRAIVVAVSIEDTDTAPQTIVSSMTYRGQSLTKINHTQVGTTFTARVELWYGLEATIEAGSGNTLSVIYNENPVGGTTVCGMLFENVLQSAPVDQGGDTVVGGDYISKTCSSVATGSWLVDAVACGNSGGYSADSGQTEKYDETVGSFRGACSYHNNPTTSEVMGWTFATGANRQALHVCEIKKVVDEDNYFSFGPIA